MKTPFDLNAPTGSCHCPQPPYTFDAGEPFHIRVASSIEDRRRAWRLVYQEYRKKGYAADRDDGLWRGIHDTLPNTTTFLVEREGTPLATLTLVFDGPLKLPSDELYPGELSDLRRQGRRPCEIISLVHLETDRSVTPIVLSHLFKLAYITARHLEDATDFVITVNPRHTAYYRKRMLFTVWGEERPFAKVSGAPALLLRLDLVTAEDRYRERFAPSAAPEANFFSFFMAEKDRLAHWLADSRQPPDPHPQAELARTQPIDRVPIKEACISMQKVAYMAPA